MVVEVNWNMRAIFRNDHGKVIMSATWNKKGYPNPIAAVGQTIINTLEVAKWMKAKKVMEFTDCKSIVDMVEKTNEDLGF